MQTVMTIISVIVIIIAFLYMRKAAASGAAEDSKTVGLVAAAGWGIMSLGGIMLLMRTSSKSVTLMSFVSLLKLAHCGNFYSTLPPLCL